MTPALPARRRAAQFDAAVEATRAGRPVDVPDDLADLLALTSALRETTPVAPRADFSSALRERLMAAAATELAAPAEAPVRDSETTRRLTVGSPGAPSTGRRERRLSVVVGAVAIVGATSSMAVASQGALPGDTLYPVKRAVEDVRTGFALGNDAKAGALLAQAEGRLREVDRLVGDGGSADRAAEVREALDTFSTQALEASDLLLTEFETNGRERSIEQLRRFTGASIDRLAELEPDVPEAARPSLSSAAKALLTIDQAAQNACPACLEPGILDLPSELITLVVGEVEPGAVIPPSSSGAPAPAPEPGVALPSIDPGLLPGSVTDPSTGPAAAGPTAGAPAPGGGSSGSTGTGGVPAPAPTPPAPSSGQLGGSLGDTVDGVGDGVGGLLEGVADGLEGALGGVGGVLGGGTAPTP